MRRVVKESKFYILVAATANGNETNSGSSNEQPKSSNYHITVKKNDFVLI